MNPKSSSSAETLAPYWNLSYLERSSQLLAHTAIDNLAIASMQLNTCSSETVGKSWCSINSISLPSQNSFQILQPPPLSSAHVSSVLEVTRTKKILLKPSSDQKKKLKQWAGAYRWAFNETVKTKEQEYVTFGKSRSYLTGRKDWIRAFREKAPWLSLVPAHTIYGAMMDADKAYSMCIRSRKKGMFANLPKCRKATQNSFYILGNAVTNKGIYIKLLGALKSKEPLPDKPSDCRVYFECGKWYLLVPESRKVAQTENQGRVCSLDPGVRTFATIFSQDKLTKIGKGLFGRIQRLCFHLDDLLSRAAKSASRKKKRMYVAASRMRVKLRNLVTDLHYQTIGWLLRNYDTVIIPECSFGDAFKKAGRRLQRKTVRIMLTLSHSKFLQRLIHKAQLLCKNVVVVNESYTSKTANWTGEIVQNLGSRTKITSNNISLDRDVNGALGIYLKALVDHPIACYRNY